MNYTFNVMPHDYRALDNLADYIESAGDGAVSIHLDSIEFNKKGIKTLSVSFTTTIFCECCGPSLGWGTIDFPSLPLEHRLTVLTQLGEYKKRGNYSRFFNHLLIDTERE